MNDHLKEQLQLQEQNNDHFDEQSHIQEQTNDQVDEQSQTPQENTQENSILDSLKKIQY